MKSSSGVPSGSRAGWVGGVMEEGGAGSRGSFRST